MMIYKNKNNRDRKTKVPDTFNSLNGKDLGVVWSAPWRIDISQAIQTGNNDLEIEVANLWPNRLIGDAGKSETERTTWTILDHPYDAKSKLLPSGLLGPVQLMIVNNNIDN